MGRRRVRHVREGSSAAHVYNDGRCVYLYDDSHTEELRALVRSVARVAPRITFFETLLVPEVEAVVAAGALALAYSLEQDDEVGVEVALGGPLTDAELSAARWLPTQAARLRLPSGRLRIETPNSIRLESRVPHDAGGLVEVPRGDHDVTLYRVDWSAMHRERVRSNVSQEVVLLTPASWSAPGTGPCVLPFPDPPPEPWQGAHEVTAAAARCLVNCGYYWSPLRLNLERAAAAPLGLRPGDLLRLRVERLVVFAIYATDEGGLESEELLARAGKSRLEELRGRHAEVAVAGFTRCVHDRKRPEGTELLTLHRYEGRKPYPVKWQEIWRPCELEVVERA